MEGVIEQGDVAGFLGHGCTCTHRQAHLGMVQGRGIVRTITGYGHYGSLLLKELYEALLVHRTGTAHHFDSEHSIQSFFIGQCGKFHTRDAVTFRIFRLPQTNLTGNLGSSTRSVTGYNLHADTCRLALAYSCRYIETNRVADGEDTQEGQATFVHQFGTIIACSFRDELIGDTEGTHGLVLKRQEVFV